MRWPELKRPLAFCASKGAEEIFLCFEEPPSSQLLPEANFPNIRFLQVHPARNAVDYIGAFPVYRLADVPRDRRVAVVVVDELNFRFIMRRLEALTQADCFIIPANQDWVVPNSLRNLTFIEAVYGTTSVAGYL